MGVQRHEDSCGLILLSVETCLRHINIGKDRRQDEVRSVKLGALCLKVDRTTTFVTEPASLL
jgi:hypothetical protein